MDPIVRAAITLVPGPMVIDITTSGRRTGEPRRKEIWLQYLDGRHYIMGRPPRPRSWYANLKAEPRFTIHVKNGATADLAAVATPILAEDERRETFGALLERMGRGDDVEEWVAYSPLVRVAIDGF